MMKDSAGMSLSLAPMGRGALHAVPQNSFPKHHAGSHNDELPYPTKGHVWRSIVLFTLL